MNVPEQPGTAIVVLGVVGVHGGYGRCAPLCSVSQTRQSIPPRLASVRYMRGRKSPAWSGDQAGRRLLNNKET